MKKINLFKQEKKTKKKRSLVIFSLIVPVMIFGLLGSLSAALSCRDPKQEKVELDFWNAYDDSDVFAPLIKEFNKEFKNVKINYYKKSPLSYETELINALAGGRGPDIFTIHNTWLPKHIDKLAPLLEKLPVGESMTIKEYQDTFVDVAFKDFVSVPPIASKTKLAERIYAMPLFVDNLALYWNKDIFDSQGIGEPPKNWHEFNQVVEKLTKKDESGNILLAGASLGTAKNINRGTDVLMMLMLQTGAKMVDDKKERAIFDQTIVVNDKLFEPGNDSLRFYTDFANPLKKVYTWNDKMDYSIDAFVQGQAAMMINYSYHIPTIKAKEPHLRFGIAPLPQPKDAQLAVNYANYWGLSVSDSSSAKEIEFAWIFVKWLTEQAQAKKYLETTRRPTARRDLVAWQQNDLEIGVFAKGSLSAKSWYQIDNLAIDKIFEEMTDAVNHGELSISEATNRAATQITLLIEEKKIKPK